MSKRKLTFDEYSRSSKYRILSRYENSSTDYDSESSSSSSDSIGNHNTDLSVDSSDSDSESDSSGNESSKCKKEKNIRVFNNNENRRASGSDTYTEEHGVNYNIPSEDEESDAGSMTTNSDASSNYSNSEDEDDCLANADELLYPGAPITVGESVLSIFVVAVRFKITGVLLAAILSLISLHCINPHNCVKSVYKLKKFFSKFDAPIFRHFYCTICFSELEEDSCPICRNNDNISHFFQISIISQLSSLFKRPEIIESLKYRHKRTKTNISNYEDVYDGSIYKSLNPDFSENMNDITFTWNTDGVKLFRSSKFEIWPFFLMINELPYRMRIKKENMILVGLWFGKEDPDPNLFVKGFKDELEQLYKGVNFEMAGRSEEVLVRGLIISGTCDLCAKALFLNVLKFNGTYGCPHCKIRTNRNQNVQTYPFVDELDLRTTVESESFAKQALRKKSPVFGVKGPTALRLIVPDYINTTAVDIMHCAFEGITKRLIFLWFDEKNRTRPFSLFSFIGLINEKIKSLTMPSFIQRIPRKLNEYSYWKASEFKLFLLVYSLLILKNVMGRVYFEHHILLVHGITLLNSSSISETMIDEAHRALIEYVRRFEILYGSNNQVLNLHLLLHLPNEVRKFGPLWTMSCFPFENLNGILKSYVHGSRHAELQICSAVTTFLSFTEIKKKILKQPVIEAYCKKIENSGTHRYKLKYLDVDIYAIGAFRKVTNLPELIQRDVQTYPNISNHSKFYIFKRLLKGSMYCEVNSYASPKKSNSAWIKYEQNGEIHLGVVSYFFTTCKCQVDTLCNNDEGNCVTYAMVNKCDAEPAFLCSVSNSYIPTMFLCERTEEASVAINVKNIIYVCYFSKIDNQMYLVLPTNMYEVE